MREMLGLGPSRWGWEGSREGRRRAVHGHIMPAPHRSHMLKPSSVLSCCCWVRPSLAEPSPSVAAAFEQCFDSLPFPPQPPWDRALGQEHLGRHQQHVRRPGRPAGCDAGLRLAPSFPSPPPAAPPVPPVAGEEQSRGGAVPAGLSSRLPPHTLHCGWEQSCPPCPPLALCHTQQRGLGLVSEGVRRFPPDWLQEESPEGLHTQSCRPGRSPRCLAQS